jgi:hypothetical protein
LIRSESTGTFEQMRRLPLRPPHFSFAHRRSTICCKRYDIGTVGRLEYKLLGASDQHVRLSSGGPVPDTIVRTAGQMNECGRHGGNEKMRA